MPRPGTVRPRNSASTARRAVAMSPSSWQCVPETSPLQCAIPLAAAPEVDADLRLCRDALADQQHLCALRKRGAARQRGHGQVQQDLFRSVGDDPRGQPAGRSLDRGEKIALVPFLIHAGRARRQRAAGGTGEVRPRLPRAAGGSCEYHLFENSVHEWVANEGPQTQKARQTVKEFIARQLRA